MDIAVDKLETIEGDYYLEEDELDTGDYFMAQLAYSFDLYLVILGNDAFYMRFRGVFRLMELRWEAARPNYSISD